MIKEGQFEGVTRPTDSAYAPGDSHSHIMPSDNDFKEFLKRRATEATPRCDLPDYTFEHHGHSQEIIPTEKRKVYDEAALEALNNPAPKDDKPASDAEKQLAGQVTEFAVRAQMDLATSTRDSKRDDDIKQLRDIFEKLDPAAAQRVVNEANKSLEGQNIRVVQSSVGEIWMGSKDKSEQPYYLNARLKEVNCAPSV